MVTEKQVPEIRFKGFEGEWEEKELGNLCLIGDIDHRMPESQGDGIPYLMTGDFIGVNDLDFKNAKLIGLKDYEQLSRKIKPEYGDILFARYASVGAVRYVATERKFLISYSCAILKTSNKPYGQCLFYNMQTERFKNQVESNVNTGSQGNVGIDSLKKMMVFLPKTNEQSAIGSYFQKLDRLINQHQQKHDKLSNLKKAMLEKMFPKPGKTTPEIRFKGFSGEWENIKLKQMAEIRRGLTYSPDDISEDGVVVLRSSNINIDKFELRKDDIKVKPSAVNIDSVKDGDILITSANGSSHLVGKHAIVNKLNLEAVHGGFMLLAETKAPYFLNASMNTFWYERFLSINVSGGNGAIGNIKGSALEEECLYVPCEAEQTAIGNYFQKLDQLINQHQEQISKLNNIKQACLSKMFV